MVKFVYVYLLGCYTCMFCCKNFASSFLQGQIISNFVSALLLWLSNSVDFD